MVPPTRAHQGTKQANLKKMTGRFAGERSNERRAEKVYSGSELRVR